MLAWIKSPRGSVATATAVAVALAGAWVAPRAIRTAPLPQRAADPGSAVTGPVSTVTGPAPVAVASPMSAVSEPARPVDTAALVREPAASAVSTPVQAGPAAPAFDVVRVDPHGEAVVAGRGVPGETVTLMDRGKVLAEVKADAGGQFALLPPALAPGEHYLTLQATRGGAVSASPQGVAVSVAGNASPPMVALMDPSQPARVLSGGAVPAAPAPSAAPAPVAIQSVETAGRGTFMAAGTAKAGSQCRLYLNGAFLADVTAGADGRWSVKVAKGMRAGRYTVRADQLEGSAGRVVTRAEVPFDFPAAAAVGHARRMLMAKALAGAPTSSEPLPARADDAAAAVIVKELQTATVVRGDSLWRISRRMLGHGVQFTEIYASNTPQIRDPRLIYPGQVFVMPHRPGQGGAASPSRNARE